MRLLLLIIALALLGMGPAAIFGLLLLIAVLLH